VNNLEVTVYTTATCPYCGMLKNYLQEKGVPFTEKLVDQDDAARDEMISKSQGYLGVPFMVINKDTGEKNVIGFDKAKINQILGIG
jgi:glutaredoxin 3